MQEKYWESPYSHNPAWKHERQKVFLNILGALEDVPTGFPVNERTVMAIHQHDMELSQFLRLHGLRPVNHVTNYRGTLIQFKTEKDAIRFRLLWPETEIVKQD